jgi:hypothetical protein
MQLEPPCGGEFEYLHRNPASSRRRRKGNPFPGSIAGPLCVGGGHKYGDLGLQVEGVSNLTQQNMVMRFAGLGP